MIAAFSIAPSGRPSASAGASATTDDASEHDDSSVHDAVAAAVRVVRASGLANRTTAMFTEIEGEWDAVFGVIKQATEAVAPYGSRISLVIKADIRPGRTGEIDAKVERLEAALDRAPADPR